MVQQEFEFVRWLFLRQTRLNLLIPYIRFLLKYRINQTISDDTDAVGKTAALIQLQKDLLTQTIMDDRLKQFPLALSYIRSFLNQLIRVLEQLFDSDSIFEDLYPMYADYIGRDHRNRIDRAAFQPGDLLDRLCRLFDQDENVGFVTYVRDTQWLSIVETNKIVASGTTGLRTWPAAIHLLDFLTENRTVLEQRATWYRFNYWKNVVELGAGSGMLGVGLITAGFIHSGQYMFTDNSEAVLKHIELNLFANRIPVSDGKLRVAIQKFDWMDHEFFDFSTSASDLILASDVLFDPALVDPLARTLAAMFRCYRNADSSSVPPRYPDCIICCCLRNPELGNYFQRKLAECNLETVELDRLVRPRWVEKITKHVTSLRQDVIVDEDFGAILQSQGDNVASVVYQIRYRAT